MNAQVWICSDDAPFVREVCDVVDRELGVAARCSSASQIDLAELPPDQHHQVLIDLRGPDAKTHLERLSATRANSDAGSASVVGVFELGYPIELTVLAEETLDAALCFSRIREALPAILHNHAENSCSSGRRSGGTRSVSMGESTFVTKAPRLHTLLDELDIAARRDVTVLFIGETGTGKTTLARIAHQFSTRQDEPLIAVSCASFTNELIGSELFGHVKGAFTGAESDKIGKFEAAGAGTILLDEVDVLSLAQQANLLRVIETGEFEPLGSNKTRKTRARTIVASNVCLQSLVDRGDFRIDLYYRLDQVKFEIPPLRARPEDIVPLALHFIEQCCQEEGVTARFIEPEFLHLIKTFDWPGNIRQLKNEVRRAALFCRDGVITSRFLSPRAQAPPEETTDDLPNNVARTERDAIQAALNFHKFNRAATARALGISRVTLYNKMRKYRIRIDRDK